MSAVTNQNPAEWVILSKKKHEECVPHPSWFVSKNGVVAYKNDWRCPKHVVELDPIRLRPMPKPHPLAPSSGWTIKPEKIHPCF